MYFPSNSFLILIISNRLILFLLEVFTSPLGLILMLNWTLKLASLPSELAYYSQYLSLITISLIYSPADLVILRWAYKYVREIGRRMEFYRGELQAGHPNFAEGSQAATQQAVTPVDISAPKIVYSKEDDDAIDEFHRRSGSYTT